MGRRTIRDGVYKTSWNDEGYDYDHGGITATTVRIGESDDDAAPVVINTALGPNVNVPLHSHPGWTLLVVLEGEFTMDDHESYGPGDIRLMKPETLYSVTAGAEGVRFIEFFQAKDAIYGGTFADESDPRAMFLREGVRSKA